MTSSATTPKLTRLIAITGKEGSGKDAYGDYLASLGYMHVSAGDFLRDIARSQGHKDPISRTILSQIGDKLKEEYGSGPITESALKKYIEKQDEYPNGLVISGLRRIGELEAIKSHGGEILWIDADDDRRVANQEMRARDDGLDQSSVAEHTKKEYLGTTKGGNQGVNLLAVEQMADYRVKNDGTLDDLFANSDTILKI